MMKMIRRRRKRTKIRRTKRTRIRIKIRTRKIRKKIKNDFCFNFLNS